MCVIIYYIIIIMYIYYTYSAYPGKRPQTVQCCKEHGHVPHRSAGVLSLIKLAFFDLMLQMCNSRVCLQTSNTSSNSIYKCFLAANFTVRRFENGCRVCVLRTSFFLESYSTWIESQVLSWGLLQKVKSVTWRASWRLLEKVKSVA